MEGNASVTSMIEILNNEIIIRKSAPEVTYFPPFLGKSAVRIILPER